MPMSERHRERRGRNIAVAGVLFVLIAIFFVASIVKMGGA
jgi:hypothetical protein